MGKVIGHVKEKEKKPKYRAWGLGWSSTQLVFQMNLDYPVGPWNKLFLGNLAAVLSKEPLGQTFLAQQSRPAGAIIDILRKNIQLRLERSSIAFITVYEN